MEHINDLDVKRALVTLMRLCVDRDRDSFDFELSHPDAFEEIVNARFQIISVENA